MGKKPEIIYTDDEQAIASGEFQAYLHLRSGYIFSLYGIFSLKGIRAENLPAGWILKFYWFWAQFQV